MSDEDVGCEGDAEFGNPFLVTNDDHPQCPHILPNNPSTYRNESMRAFNYSLGRRRFRITLKLLVSCCMWVPQLWSVRHKRFHRQRRISTLNLQLQLQQSPVSRNLLACRILSQEPLRRFLELQRSKKHRFMNFTV